MVSRSTVEVEICYLYAPEDASLVEGLEKHLSFLKRERLVSVWHMGQIASGDSTSSALNEHLNSASIILVFISPDFLVSDYCESCFCIAAMGDLHCTGH